MSYTLKSNAINAAAKIFFVGDNGLTNLVGGGSITNTGTVSTSTIDGHTAYGFANNTAGQYLSASIADGVPANTKYTVLMVGRFGVTAANDVTIAIPPTAGFSFGAGQATPKAVVATPYLGGAAGATLPSYAFPNTIGYMLIEGRDTNGAIRTYANDTLATPWTGDSGSRGETIAAGEWKFLGRPATGQGGFGGSIVALFIGVGPQEVYDYIVANAGSATGIERVYSALLDAGSTAVTGDSSITLGAITGTASGTVSTAGSVTGSSAITLGALGSSAAGTVTAFATFTSEPLKTNNGTLQASLALDWVRLYNVTTGALVVTKTGISTNGAGVFTVTDAALTVGQTYKADWKITTTGETRMPSKAAT